MFARTTTHASQILESTRVGAGVAASLPLYLSTCWRPQLALPHAHDVTTVQKLEGEKGQHYVSLKQGLENALQLATGAQLKISASAGRREGRRQTSMGWGGLGRARIRGIRDLPAVVLRPAELCVCVRQYLQAIERAFGGRAEDGCMT